MASKFKRQQRRKRWNDLGTFFPAHYEPEIFYLQSFSTNLSTGNYCNALIELTSCSSTYKEIPQIRKVCDFLVRIWNETLNSISSDSIRLIELKLALQLVVEILFFENSRPLHRTIFSSLSRFPKEHILMIEECISKNCCHYGIKGKKFRPFSTVPLAASITSAQFQSFMDSTANCCTVKLARALIADVAKVIEISTSGSVTPAMMDECQEALSSLYYLAQRFSHNFLPIEKKKKRMNVSDASKVPNRRPKIEAEMKYGEDEIEINFERVEDEVNEKEKETGDVEKIRKGEVASDFITMDEDDDDDGDGDGDGDDDGYEAYIELIKTLLRVLQMGNLSRDCIVAASVALCALIQIKANPRVLSLYLAKSFFGMEKSIVNNKGKNFATVINDENESGHFAVQGSSESVTDPLQKDKDQSSEEYPNGTFSEASENMEEQTKDSESIKTEFGVFDSKKLLIDFGKEVEFPFLNALPLCNINSLEEEGRKFTAFARLCWFRGILTSMQKETLNANLQFRELRISNTDFMLSNSKSSSNLISIDFDYQKRWTLLFDGLLIELCHYCHLSSDSHFKYHAITSLQMCLHQIKSSLQGGYVKIAAEEYYEQSSFTKLKPLLRYEPLSMDAVDKILQVVWSNWEDPLNQTVKQIQLVFEFLVDIVQEYYSKHAMMVNYDFKSSMVLSPKPIHVPVDSNEREFDSLSLFTVDKESFLSDDVNSELNTASQTSMDIDQKIDNDAKGVKDDDDFSDSKLDQDVFLGKIAMDLVAVSPQRKGRYVPLASLSQRITAIRLLKINPFLLHDSMMAMVDDGVCCAISAFLKTFLERLREECWQMYAGDVQSGSAMWQAIWIPPLLTGLLSGNFKLRGNLTTYALSVSLLLESHCLWWLIETILLLDEEEDDVEEEGKNEKRHVNYTWDDSDAELGEEKGRRRMKAESNKKKWEECFEMVSAELGVAVKFPFSVSYEKKIGGIISVLKVCRVLGLVEGGMDFFFEKSKINKSNQSTRNANKDDAIDGDGKERRKKNYANMGEKEEERVLIPIQMIEISITHLDDALRIDSAELICLNPKTSAMPSKLELKLLKLSIPLNLRSPSTSFRMRWTSLMKKFFQRIKSAVEKKSKRLGVEENQVKLNFKTADVARRKFIHKLGFSPEFATNQTKNVNRVEGRGEGMRRERIEGKEDGGEEKQAKEEEEEEDEYEASMDEVESFMQWFSSLLLNSLYPNSPYERKNMVMEFLNVLFEIYDTKKYVTVSNSLDFTSNNDSQTPVLNPEPKQNEHIAFMKKIDIISTENTNHTFKNKHSSFYSNKKDLIYFKNDKYHPSGINISSDIFFANSNLLQSAFDSSSPVSAKWRIMVVPRHPQSTRPLQQHKFCPFPIDFFSPECTQVVINSIVNSWDRLREGAFTVLMQYPSPIPGFVSPSSVEKILAWAKKLVSSPRVRESDAGALILRFIFKKYVIDLQWVIHLYPYPKVFNGSDLVDDEKEEEEEEEEEEKLLHVGEGDVNDRCVGNGTNGRKSEEEEKEEKVEGRNHHDEEEKKDLLALKGIGAAGKDDDVASEGIAICHYVESLNDWLEAGIEEGERNMVKACEKSLVHGVLLAMRYTMDEIKWTSMAVMNCADRLRKALQRLLSLLLKVSSLALSVVSMKSLHMPNREDIGREGEGGQSYGGLSEVESERRSSLKEDNDNEKESRMENVSVERDEDSVSEEELFMKIGGMESRMDIEETGEDEDAGGEGEGEGGGIAPTDQMIMVACWLSMKEVSLLLGSLSTNVPLPENDFIFFEEENEDSKNLKNSKKLEKNNEEAKNDGRKNVSDAEKKNYEPMLDADQLESIGNHFLKVLLSMKHNGAIDKTKTGFISICERLLRSNSHKLNRLPELWLKKLCDRMVTKGQNVDDVVRRSAGIPASFLALFLSEPEGLPKKLLPKAMKWMLQNIADFSEKEEEKMRLQNVDRDNGTAENDKNLLKSPEEKPKLDEVSAMASDSMALENAGKEMEMASMEEVLKDRSNAEEDAEEKEEDGAGEEKKLKIKTREEGVVPTVHAFNTLRLTFHDSNLVTDASGFCADGLKWTVRGFTSRHWEIKNSSCLCFSALLHRTLGYLNVLHRETARRAITGFEFFHRYPSLHPFLLSQLESATLQFMEHDVSMNNYEFSRSLHPSLCPILILLSRLKPSVIHTRSEDWLSPSAFIPFVLSCSTQKHFHIRKLSSLALPPLVPSRNLTAVILELFSRLPMVSENLKKSKKSQTKSHSESGDTDIQTSDGVHAYFPKMSNSNKTNFNSMHGMLLQLCGLFKNNCANVPDVQVQKNILLQTIPLYEARSWLGNPNQCSCPSVTTEFLRLGGTFLEISRGVLDSEAEVSNEAEVSEFARFESSILNLCMKNLEMDEEDWMKKQIFDPTAVLSREMAASIFFKFNLELRVHRLTDVIQIPESHNTTIVQSDNPDKWQNPIGMRQRRVHVINSQKDEVANYLYRALTDSMYEVRLSALKSLSRWMKSLHKKKDDFYAYIAFRLRPMLLERVKGKEHHLCLRKIMSLLFEWKDVEGGKEEEKKEKEEGMIRINEKTKITKNSVSDSVKDLGKVSKKDSENDSDNNFEILMKEKRIWESDMNVIQLWYLFLNIFKSSSHVKTKEIAIRCMGACIRHVIKFMHLSIQHDFRTDEKDENAKTKKIKNGIFEFESIFFSHAKEIFDVFLKEMEELSQPYLSASMRVAAMDAIIASELLEEAQFANFVLSNPNFSSSVKSNAKTNANDSSLANKSIVNVGKEEEEEEEKEKEGEGKDDIIESNNFVFSEYYGNLILKIWIISIKLLEDENFDLRKKLSLKILQIVSSCGRKKYFFDAFRIPESEKESGEMSGGDLSKFCGRKSIPCQVEVVIQMSFEHLFSKFGKFFFFFDALLFWAADENFHENGHQNLDMVRKLFDKEIDNHHEEKLLFIQLCLFYVRKIILHSIDLQNFSMKKSFLGKILTCQTKIMSSLYTDVIEISELQKRMDWFVTITNHQDIFLSLYRKFLSLISLSLPFPIENYSYEKIMNGEDKNEDEDEEGSTYSHGEEDEKLVNESLNLKLIVENLKAIRQNLTSMPLNPLIQSSLLLTLKLFENQFDIKLGFHEMLNSKCVNLDDYEPFFLL